jgi:hypothetical protein
MAALTTAQEYQAVREAIQQLTTLGTDGKRRDRVSVSIDGVSVSYSGSQLDTLMHRERELASRLCQRNARKRTTPDFSY